MSPALRGGPRSRRTRARASSILDVGCGSGIALRMAADRGARRRRRSTPRRPSSSTRAGASRARTSASATCSSCPTRTARSTSSSGFNSFQYAADAAGRARARPGACCAPAAASRRMVWGPAEQCELAPHLAAVGALMPPPAARRARAVQLLGSRGAAALRRGGRLRGRRWWATPPPPSATPTSATALRGLLSAGPVRQGDRPRRRGRRARRGARQHRAEPPRGRLVRVRQRLALRDRPQDVS